VYRRTQCPHYYTYDGALQPCDIIGVGHIARIATHMMCGNVRATPLVVVRPV
jgi:hypothetical protein